MCYYILIYTETSVNAGLYTAGYAVTYLTTPKWHLEIETPLGLAPAKFKH
jgi:hypothetical protein